MTAVLKNAVATSLRAAPQSPPIDPHVAALERDLAEARAALSKARDQLAAAERRAIEERDAAHAEGVEEGRRAAEDDGAQRRDQLATAIDAATTAWHARLDDLEPLAVTLARAALDRLFAGVDHADLVAATIRRHLDALRTAGATTIHVHPALVDGLDDHGLAVAADRSMKSGECRVALALGQADLSIDAQWRAIDAVLATWDAPR